MAENKERKTPWDEWDGEYIGNIWGWKYSFISLGIILFVLALMFYRYHTMETPLPQDFPVEKTTKDTIGTKIEGG